MENESRVVLVVEDEALIRWNASEAIEAAGYRTVQACDADEALKILDDRSDVEVIFTDINMPGSMDGMSLANFVKEKWPRILLILTSGRLTSNLESMIPEGGRFFSKPYSLSALVEAIQHVR